MRARPIRLAAPVVISVGFWRVVRLCAVAATAATLTACAQSAVASNKSAISRQVPPEETRSTPLVTNRRVTRVTERHSPSRDAVGRQNASQGIASFYKYDGETASGEKFNPNEMTAAHPTLPFGTRLRVTNAATGRSVTVRINDRGPYIRGRVVDLSYSAAEKLGIVEQGVAKVKLDVVH
jgi:rare lipoprotein A